MLRVVLKHEGIRKLHFLTKKTKLHNISSGKLLNESESEGNKNSKTNKNTTKQIGLENTGDKEKDKFLCLANNSPESVLGLGRPWTQTRNRRISIFQAGYANIMSENLAAQTSRNNKPHNIAATGASRLLAMT